MPRLQKTQYGTHSIASVLQSQYRPHDCGMTEEQRKLFDSLITAGEAGAAKLTKKDILALFEEN